MFVQRPAGTRRPSNLNLRRGPSTNRSYSINTEALVLDGGPGLWVCRAVGVPGLWASRGCGCARAYQGVPGLWAVQVQGGQRTVLEASLGRTGLGQGEEKPRPQERGNSATGSPDNVGIMTPPR